MSVEKLSINTRNVFLIEKLTLGITVLAVISLITLGLLYSGLPFFGPVNDLTNAASGLLTVFLVIQFFDKLRKRTPLVAWILSLTALAGGLLVIISSLMVAAGRLHWMTGGMYLAIGYGLIGCWLLAVNLMRSDLPYLTKGVRRLGLITAVTAWFGFAAGPLLASGVNLSQSPITNIVYIGSAAGWLLYPLWCFLLAKNINRI